jgi:hypothetical protein
MQFYIVMKNTLEVLNINFVMSQIYWKGNKAKFLVPHMKWAKELYVVLM